MPSYKKVHLGDVAPNTRRGGEIFTLLSPGTVDCTSGFMGVARMRAGESIAEHYHPYSEEFVYLVSGELEVDIDGQPHRITSGEAALIPINTRHRLRNESDGEAFLVFHCGPLAPRPELGHVDTEIPR